MRDGADRVSIVAIGALASSPARRRDKQAKEEMDEAR
jgi:hypothetical protein